MSATATPTRTSVAAATGTSVSPARVASALALPHDAAIRELRTDVAVIGSGIAGLTLATSLRAAGIDVTVVTKGSISDANTAWAQGGVAVALDAHDSPQSHFDDTVVAGAGLSDEDAVRELVESAPAAVEWLMRSGAEFDRDARGQLELGREGGHSANRILHAGGDATGPEIERALVAATRVRPGVRVLEHTFATDAALDASGALAGVVVERDGVVWVVSARAAVIATGGIGQAFAVTTNPSGATGDGIALGLRAGAEVADLEFVQFHPTVFYTGRGARGRQLLISEAVRGEGATLVDLVGDPVMAGVHPLGDLAPRDVVSATIAARLAATGTDHVLLDARGIGGTELLRRFPTIVAGCRAAGVDPVTEPIPVVPAEHYSCGGIRADLSGVTSVPGLYAIGEAACTGVHGANRLASNSLLEGLVAGRWLAADLAAGLPPRRRPERPRNGSAYHPSWRGALQTGMSRHAGVLRDPAGLASLGDLLSTGTAAADGPSRQAWEVTNLHTVATAIATAASLRRESRGAHRRADVPALDPRWERRLSSRLRHGTLRTEPHG